MSILLGPPDLTLFGGDGLDYALGRPCRIPQCPNAAYLVVTLEGDRVNRAYMETECAADT